VRPLKFLCDKSMETGADRLQRLVWSDFFSYGSTTQFWALSAFMKLFVSFRFLDLEQSAGLLGQVISSSQGLC
jgi:hypothetical protein